MTPLVHNFDIVQGATLNKRLVWRDKTKRPMNLTGCTARMHVRATVDSPVILIDLTTENGGILLGGAAGTITIRIEDDAAALLNFTDAVYDMMLTDSVGDTHPVMRGKIKFVRSSTRLEA